MSTRSAAHDAQRIEELAHERDVLLSSIEDLEREHVVGDVDEADYATLRADYVARAAATLRTMEALAGAADDSTEAERPGEATAHHARRVARLRRFLGRPRTRIGLGVVGAICLLGLVGLTAAHLAGVRLPGQDSSGSVTLSKGQLVSQQLEQAAILGSEGKLTEAVELYGTILKESPRQPEALTYRAWLIRLAGLADHDKAAVALGDNELALAVRTVPRYGPAHALDGVAVLEDRDRLSVALAQFRSFLADHPSSGLIELLGSQMAAAFSQDHEAVPARLRHLASTSSSTTTTTLAR